MKTFHYNFAPTSKWVRCRDASCQSESPLLHTTEDMLKDAFEYYTKNLSMGYYHRTRESKRGMLLNLALVRHYLDNIAVHQTLKTADYVNSIITLYPSTSEFWVDYSSFYPTNLHANSYMSIYSEEYTDTSPQEQYKLISANDTSYFSELGLTRMAAKINYYLYADK